MTGHRPACDALQQFDDMHSFDQRGGYCGYAVMILPVGSAPNAFHHRWASVQHV